MIKIRTIQFNDIMEAATTKATLTTAGYVVQATSHEFMSLDVFMEEEIPEPIKPAPVSKKQVIIERISEKWSIYKRTLPLTIDKVLYHGLDRESAESKVQHLIAKEQKRREDVMFREQPLIPIVYDLIPSEATEDEKSPFYNPRLVVMGE